MTKTFKKLQIAKPLVQQIFYLDRQYSPKGRKKYSIIWLPVLVN